MTTDLLPESGTSAWLSVSPLSVGPALVVVVAGEADWDTAPQFRDQVVAALGYGPRSLLLDLTDLTFCNLQGLRALLEAVEVAQRAGVDVTMRGMSDVQSRLYRMVTRTRGPVGSLVLAGRAR